jgi:hypothetical protein
MKIPARSEKKQKKFRIFIAHLQVSWTVHRLRTYWQSASPEILASLNLSLFDH